MSTIIILTDFSPLASNAMEYGAALAQKTGSDIDLVHIYELPMAINQSTADVMPVYLAAEEIKKSSEESMDKTLKAFREKHPRVAVNSTCRAGTSVAAEIEDITKGKHILAIVTGVHEIHGIESILGSTPNSLIKTSRHIVIAVPASYHTFSFKKAIVATDMQKVHTRAKNKMLDFLQKLGVAVELVYVKTEKSKEEISPEKLMNQFNALSPSFKTLEGEDVAGELDHYVKESGSDMLIAFSLHHSVFEKLFSKKHMKDILEHTSVPVVSIPKADN